MKHSARRVSLTLQGRWRCETELRRTARATRIICPTFCGFCAEQLQDEWDDSLSCWRFGYTAYSS
ncbi:Uncharacterized protein DAT39_023477 [Clarias magur]|uniref:Uncharacterized protein n=1 Tax=Clarias magur TaxID=1594786 RepID=A0A8J4TSA0_CLAMG|nr:Uncharacterized protein DAT39_023477 [Clarias magur]